MLCISWESCKHRLFQQMWGRTHDCVSQRLLGKASTAAGPQTGGGARPSKGLGCPLSALWSDAIAGGREGVEMRRSLLFAPALNLPPSTSGLDPNPLSPSTGMASRLSSDVPSWECKMSAVYLARHLGPHSLALGSPSVRSS